MREIKFKAKRVDDGVWVYGSYTAMREEDHNECFRTKPHKIYHRIWQWESGDWNMGGYAIVIAPFRFPHWLKATIVSL